MYYVALNGFTLKVFFYSCNKKKHPIKIFYAGQKSNFYAWHKNTFITAIIPVFLAGKKIFITIIKIFYIWHKKFPNFNFIKTSLKYHKT